MSKLTITKTWERQCVFRRNINGWIHEIDFTWSMWGNDRFAKEEKMSWWWEGEMRTNPRSFSSLRKDFTSSKPISEWSEQREFDCRHFRRRRDSIAVAWRRRSGRYRLDVLRNRSGWRLNCSNVLFVQKILVDGRLVRIVSFCPEIVVRGGAEFVGRIPCNAFVLVVSADERDFDRICADWLTRLVTGSGNWICSLSLTTDRERANLGDVFFSVSLNEENLQHFRT